MPKFRLEPVTEGQKENTEAYKTATYTPSAPEGQYTTAPLPTDYHHYEEHSTTPMDTHYDMHTTGPMDYTQYDPSKATMDYTHYDMPSSGPIDYTYGTAGMDYNNYDTYKPEEYHYPSYEPYMPDTHYDAYGNGPIDHDTYYPEVMDYNNYDTYMPEAYHYPSYEPDMPHMHHDASGYDNHHSMGPYDITHPKGTFELYESTNGKLEFEPKFNNYPEMDYNHYGHADPHYMDHQHMYQEQFGDYVKSEEPVDYHYDAASYEPASYETHYDAASYEPSQEHYDTYHGDNHYDHDTYMPEEYHYHSDMPEYHDSMHYDGEYDHDTYMPEEYHYHSDMPKYHDSMHYNGEYAPVEGTFKPSFTDKSATHHYVESTRKPTMPKFRLEPVTEGQKENTEAYKTATYTPSAPEGQYTTAPLPTDYHHYEEHSTTPMDTHYDMHTTGPMDYTQYDPSKATMDYTHYDMPSSGPIDYTYGTAGMDYNNYDTYKPEEYHYPSYEPYMPDTHYDAYGNGPIDHDTYYPEVMDYNNYDTYMPEAYHYPSYEPDMPHMHHDASGYDNHHSMGPYDITHPKGTFELYESTNGKLEFEPKFNNYPEMDYNHYGHADPHYMDHQHMYQEQFGDYVKSEEPVDYHYDAASYEPASYETHYDAASYEPSQEHYDTYHGDNHYDHDTYMPEEYHYHSDMPEYHDSMHYNGEYDHDTYMPEEYYYPSDMPEYHMEHNGEYVGHEYDHSYHPEETYHYENEGSMDYDGSHDGHHASYDHVDHEYDHSYHPEETYHYENEGSMDYDGSHDGHHASYDHVDHEYDHSYHPEETYHYENEGSMDGSYAGSHDGHHASYDHNDEHYNNEHEYEPSHESEEHDDMPECLKDCSFLGMESPEGMCEWWLVEGPQYNKESCINDCSPGVTHYVKEKFGGMCAEEPVEEVDPLACVMDCPIHELDPHSAESFCPWFVQERKNTCFHDCTDEFLNMAQDHAEYTCGEWYQGEHRFTNFYIIEPMADLMNEQYIDAQDFCPAGYTKNGDKCEVCPAATFSYAATFECIQCPSELTSMPGSTSEEECFKREELLTVESHDDASYGSEDHSDMAADHYSNEDSFSGSQ